MRLRHRPQWPVLVTCYLILVTSRAKRARMEPKTGLVELRSSPTDSIPSDFPISVPQRGTSSNHEVLVPSSATPSERLSYDPWLSFESEGWCPRLDWWSCAPVLRTQSCRIAPSPSRWSETSSNQLSWFSSRRLQLLPNVYRMIRGSHLRAKDGAQDWTRTSTPCGTGF